MSLSLLCDGIPNPLYIRLDRRFEVEEIKDVSVLGPSANYADIWDWADASDYNIFTDDRALAMWWKNRSGTPHPGVIRYKGQDWGDIETALIEIDRQYGTSFIAKNELNLQVPDHWVP